MTRFNIKNRRTNKIIFIAIGICCYTTVFGQTTERKQINSLADVENWIVSQYHPDSIKKTKICQQSCVFIKFKLLKNGKVGELAFNKEIPEFITDALAETFKHMENEVTISDELRSDEKTYLLPFIYDYQSGCRKNFLEKKSMTDKAGHRIDIHLQGEAIFNMLNFNDKSLLALDCIILSPISVGDVVMN